MMAEADMDQPMEVIEPEVVEPEVIPATSCLPGDSKTAPATSAAKRKRAENWRDEEKIKLLELIGPSVEVIENKTKLLSVNQNKEDHWNRIHKEFLAKGYNRPISRLKEQWRRMKLQSRRSIESANGEIKPSGIDNIVSGMMAHLEDVGGAVKKDEPEEKVENCLAKDFVEDQSKIITAFLKQSVKVEDAPRDVETISVDMFEESSAINGESTAKIPVGNSSRVAISKPVQQHEEELFKLSKQKIAEEMRHNEELYKLKKSNMEKEHSMRLSMQKKLYEAKLKLIFHNYTK